MPSSIRAASPQPVSAIAHTEPQAPSLPPRPKTIRIVSQSQERPLSQLFSASKSQPLGAPITSAPETSGARGPSLEALRSPVPRPRRGDAARARPLSMSDAPKHDTSLQLFNENAYRTGAFAAPSSKSFLGIDFNAHARDKVVRRLQDQSQALLEGKLAVEQELHHVKDDREQLDQEVRTLRRSLAEAHERSRHYRAGENEHRRLASASHARLSVSMEIIQEELTHLEEVMAGGACDTSGHDASSVRTQESDSASDRFRFHV